MLALIGYLAKYLNDLRLAQRKDRLERVNRQLNELYGPLFALSRASTIAFEAFQARYGRTSIWSDQPTEEDMKTWQLWMTEVFMPHNNRMQETVIENAELLDESEMPECLLNLSAHVLTYKTVLKRWDAGDFSEWWSVVSFPKGILEYSKNAYSRLKARQLELLGSSWRHSLMHRRIKEPHTQTKSL